MTRVQFLNDLYRRLGALSREEAENHLTYYAEMLADRMEEGMTEEEAVASMEDVDTIAERILQDAGVRTETPTVDDVVVQAMEEPKEKRSIWKRIFLVLVVIAVVLAILVPVLQILLGFTVWRQVMDPGIVEAHHAEIKDHGTIHIEPESGNVISVTPGTERTEIIDTVETPVVDAVDNTYAVTADGVQNINIEWVSGAVLIEPCEGADIVFIESSTSELKEAEKLTYTLRDNGELTIKFAPQGLKTFSKTKNLTVWIPVTMMLNEIEVSTVSANVEIRGSATVELNLETTSGDILASGSFGKVSVESTSGDVTLKGGTASIEAETTSGNLTVEVDDTQSKLDVESISGDVELTLPAGAAFDLHYETASGELDGGGFAMKQSSGDNYTIGNGGSRFEVETVSGDLRLKSK